MNTTLIEKNEYLDTIQMFRLIDDNFIGCLHDFMCWDSRKR